LFNQVSSLSIVIPCYNEEKSIPELVARCGRLYDQHGIEFILVDNGSLDNSRKILEIQTQNLRGVNTVFVDKNLGYGFGIRQGLAATKSTYTGWTHADLQTDIGDVVAALEVLNTMPNASVFVKGNRSGRPIFDTLFTFGMSIFESLLFRTRLWDINAQPTIFSSTLLNDFVNAPDDFSLDLFAYLTAKKQGYSVHRIPVYFHKRVHGVSSWNVGWRSRIKFIRRTLNFSFELRNRVNADH
jgi:glycosyltransferase involved in cell wall biosynthesis